VLADNCHGEPFASRGFGSPTVDIPAIPAYGRFVKVHGGVRAIAEEEAGARYRDLLEILEETGFEFVCLLARDVKPPERFHHFCGLQTAAGEDKSFTPDLIEYLHG